MGLALSPGGFFMRLVPINDKIVVRRDEAADKSKAGILLPDTAKEKPRRGKVLALGNGRILDNGSRLEWSIEEGQTVIFGHYAGTEVDVDGEAFLILSESDILAILK